MNIIVRGISLASVASGGWLLAACGAQAAQQDAARASYATELQLCVADAGSRADADACRKAVDARYGVDAGLFGAK